MMQREKEIDDAGARHSALVEEENVCDCSTQMMQLAKLPTATANRSPTPRVQR
jgi:hypothetical protein